MTSKRVIAILTAVMIALTGVFTSGSASAQATPAQADLSFYYVKHNQSGQCLDGSLSQGIRLSPCVTGNSYQTYLFETGTWSELTNPNDFCVDGSVSAGVRARTCTVNNTYQQWRYYSSTDELVHRQSGLCLDASVSAGVRLLACNGGAYQKWTLV